MMNAELDQWLARIEAFIADPTDDTELDASDVPRLVRELRKAHARIDRLELRIDRMLANACPTDD